MIFFNKKLTIVAVAIASVFSSSTFAFENANQQQDASSAISAGKFSGNFRLGYISTEDNNGDSVESSAIGGELSYSSASWNGISATGSLYTTQKLFNDDNGDFFASDGDSYAILGQAYLQANVGATEVKVGRFGFDSPHADMDDIRMVPNTFSGILITNNDLSDTTVYLAHLDKWSGVDSDKPEDFTDMNNSDGVNVFGAVYEGIENVALQSWYYNINDLADLIYLEAMVEVEQFSIGVQYAKQSDNSDDNTGPDGDVYGITASYTLNDFTFSSAYNHVSGTIINGFGGGPFFSNAEDHTIDGVIDQKALRVGIDYSGIDNVTIGLAHVDFDEGEDETDLLISYDFGNDMAFDFTYHHMHDDGDMVLAMFNIGF